MITNDEGISLEIWNQFIGSDVLSIAFWKAESTASSSFHFISFWLIYIIISMITPYTTSHNHAYSHVSFPLILTDIASSAMLSLCTAL